MTKVGESKQEITAQYQEKPRARIPSQRRQNVQSDPGREGDIMTWRCSVCKLETSQLMHHGRVLTRVSDTSRRCSPPEQCKVSYPQPCDSGVIAFPQFLFMWTPLLWRSARLCSTKLPAAKSLLANSESGLFTPGIVSPESTAMLVAARKVSITQPDQFTGFRIRKSFLPLRRTDGISR